MPRPLAALALLVTAASLEAQVPHSLLTPGAPVRVTLGDGADQIRQTGRLKRLAGDTIVLTLNRRDEMSLLLSQTTRAEVATRRPANGFEVARGVAVGAGMGIVVRFLSVAMFQAAMGPEWEVRPERSMAQSAMIGGLLGGASALIAGGRRWARFDDGE